MNFHSSVLGPTIILIMKTRRDFFSSREVRTMCRANLCRVVHRQTSSWRVLVPCAPRVSNRLVSAFGSVMCVLLTRAGVCTLMSYFRGSLPREKWTPNCVYSACSTRYSGKPCAHRVCTPYKLFSDIGRKQYTALLTNPYRLARGYLTAGLSCLCGSKHQTPSLRIAGCG